MKREWKSDPSLWKRSHADLFRAHADGTLRIVSLRIPLPGRFSFLDGRRIFFLSDTHLRPTGAFPSEPGLSPWSNTGFPGDEILREADSFHPDFTLFGGDLVRHICCFDAGIAFLKALPGRWKLAVYGNWDKRRAAWFPFRVFEQELKHASFHPLLNEPFVMEGIRFWGMDDFKFGLPRYVPPRTDEIFSCVLAHNPDAVPYAMSPDDLRSVSLILCGHTHGGQIRLPGYGAVLTSSVFGKRFEYGLYEHRESSVKLYVTAGIGITFLPVRFRCPPEIVKITLVRSGE